MGTPSAPFLELAGTVRRELGVPVMHAARIGDASTGRRIATGEKAAAAATADSSTMVRIVYPRLREHRRFGVSAGEIFRGSCEWYLLFSLL